MQINSSNKSHQEAKESPMIFSVNKEVETFPKQENKVSSEEADSSGGEEASKFRKNENLKNGKWSEEEDEQLKILVRTYGNKNWKNVAEHMPTRSAVQCLHRWTKILQPGLVKGPWTIEEDRHLIEWVRMKGPHKWSHCADYIKGRSGKQCRERWFNTLNPNVKKGNWSAEEDFKIFQLFYEYGSKWSKIASFFNGRTENSIKNRFYSTLRRIHAEKKKEVEGDCAKDSSLTSLEDLLQYFPEALAEKSKAFEEERMSNNSTLNLMLNKKTNREAFEKENESKETRHNFNNLNNLNNINNNKTEIKIMPHLELSSSNLSPENMSPVQRNLDNLNLDAKLNKNNNMNNAGQNNVVNLNPIYPMQDINFLNIVAQLNQFSNNLMNTKNQLMNFDHIKNNFLMMTNNLYPNPNANLYYSKNFGQK